MTIGIYAARTSPQVHYDNRKLRLQLLNGAMNKLRASLGEYVINGMTVFCCYNEETPKDCSTDVQGEDQTYKVNLRFVKKVAFADIKNPDPRKSAVVYGFLNNLVKAFLMKLDYMESGKSKKYFKHQDQISLPNAGVVLYKGFGTSFTLLESGLYLKIDSSTRVVQNSTALTAINTFYAMHKNDDKDSKRNKLRDEFRGKTVMANYGNHRYWRVEDIEFDQDTERFVVNKETNQTLSQYYKEKYNMAIEKPKQPLIKAKLNEVKKKGG